MIKKILTGILTASMIASFAVLPVSADYESLEYDIEQFSYTYDDGTVTNAIDNTPALQTADTDFTRIFRSTLNTTNGFCLSFDFCFDSASAEIQIPQLNSDGSKVDKVGPIITYGWYDSKDQTKLQLRTQTGSSSYQALGEFTIGDWYSAEIEGRTGITQDYTSFRLYNSAKELVFEQKSFNMRNLSSNDRSFNAMQTKGVSLDNVKLIAENPDTIEISSTSGELSAGQSVALDYTMLRGENEFTKHPVEWSVRGDNVSVTPEGSLLADINAANQTVTVTASVSFGDKTLTGTKDITVKAVDTADEKFNNITVAGADSIKAGTSEVYTVTATKDGVPVDVTNEDIVWSVYDFNNINPYYDASFTNSKVIDVENGTFTVADGVLPQTVTLRASSISGKVYGSKTINIDLSDSQTETVVMSDAYEKALLADNKTVSVDGSIAYAAANALETKFGNQNGYTLTEMDIKFTAEGSGIVLKRNDGAKTNTQITYKNGNLSTNASALITDAELNAWYRLEILYSTTDASCNIYKYNADGTLGEPQKFLSIDRRNAEQYGMIRLEAGTCVDNLKISKPLPYELELSAPKENLFPDETLEISATASRNGLPLKDTEGISWSVLDEGNLPIIDGTITINESGVLKVTPLALAQKIKVQAKTATGAVATFDVNIQSGDIFTITNIGINEDKTKVVKLYVDKNFNYSDSVVFFIAVYDDNDVLQGLTHLNRFGDTLNVGENEIPLDYTLPAGFDPETDKITVMVWTALS